MAAPFESPRNTTSGRRRLEELREKRKKASVFEALGRSRSIIIINITIEIASAVIVLVGVAYLIRFFRMQRYAVDPLLYRLIAVCLGVFVVGWMVYLSIRVRHYILLLSQSRRKETDS